MSRPSVYVEHDAEGVAEAGLHAVLAAEKEAIAYAGEFRIALAGGSTPRRLYEKLASSSADFPRWHVFFGDERWVPAGHPDSNATMARETLLSRVAIPPRQVHDIDTGTGAPDRAAAMYAHEVRRGVPARLHGLPRFDVILLGMGADGHTASLFPGSSALDAADHDICVCTRVPAPNPWRLTLTFGVLNAAARVVFLVAGADKAPALGRVLRGDESLPAARVRPRGGALTWIADEAAAAEIP